MKLKTMAFILVCLFFALPGFAQSLLDNPDYQTGLQFQKTADESYASGDYDAAYRYSAQAAEYFQKALDAMDKDKLKSQADSLIKTVDARLAKLDAKKAARDFADQYTTATTKEASAKQAFSTEDYRTSIGEAQAALAALDEIDALLAKNGTATVAGQIVLPRYYVVRIILGNRDCLWNIAGYPFVYNDPMKWRKLYDANKKLLVAPTDPDLILPRQVFEIPPLAGEKREGTYDPKKTYPSLPKKK